MKRVALERRTRMKRSLGTVWPPKVRDEIRERDGGCVGPRIGMPGDCLGPVDIDHVRASHGIGMKSRSTADNGVCLCRWQHHPIKTEGKVLTTEKWRERELDYLAIFGYPPHPDDAVPA